jgi:hypothetical protein
LIFAYLDPTFMRCGDILGGNDVAGVEISEEGVVNSGARADVAGAGENGELRGGDFGGGWIWRGW